MHQAVAAPEASARGFLFRQPQQLPLVMRLSRCALRLVQVLPLRLPLNLSTVALLLLQSLQLPLLQLPMLQLPLSCTSPLLQRAPLAVRPLPGLEQLLLLLRLSPVS
jgi:hypothetical protein